MTTRIAKLITSLEEASDVISTTPVQLVTPEAETEADLSIATLIEETNDLQAEQIQDTNDINELKGEIVALENYIEILQYGIENNEYSTQFAAMVSSYLDQYKNVKGTSVPALENYNSESMEEYYKVSIEAAKGILQKVNDHITAIKTRIARRLKVLGSEKKNATTYITKADALLGRLDKVGNKTVTIPTNGLLRYLGMGGKLPADIAGACKKDLKSRKYLTNEFIRDSEKFFNAVMDILYMSKGPFIPDAESGMIIALKHPSSKIPKGILNGSEIFATQLAVKEVKGDSDKEITKAINHVKTEVERNSIILKDGPKELKLTSGDVKAILNVAKQYSEFSKAVGDNDLSFYDTSKFKYDSGMKPVVLDSLLSSHEAAFIVEFNTAIDARHINVSLLQMAERAIKEMEKERKSEE